VGVLVEAMHCARGLARIQCPTGPDFEKLVARLMKVRPIPIAQTPPPRYVLSYYRIIVLSYYRIIVLRVCHVRVRHVCSSFSYGREGENGLRVPTEHDGAAMMNNDE
jgi:hypothetical protein